MFSMGYRRAKSTQGNTNFQKRFFWQTLSGSLPASVISNRCLSSRAVGISMAWQILTRKNKAAQQTQNLPLATVIEDHQIEEVVRHKHLGITFTSDLKWNVHIQEVIGNAAKRAGLLRWMSHHLSHPPIAHLYLPYVCPTMEYASPLSHGSTRRDEDALQLKRIQAQQQSLAESCMPRGTLRTDNFLKNSTGLLFDGVEK